MYQDADVYIFDDPLSAVDVHVGRHIFDKFINGAIQHKARLLVTNQLTFLPQADKIVMIEKGEIVAQGTFEECQECASFVKLLSEHNAKAGEGDGAEKGDKKPKAPRAVRRDVTAKLIQDAMSTNPATGNKLASMPSKIDRSETFVKIPEAKDDIDSKGKGGMQRDRKSVV